MPFGFGGSKSSTDSVGSSRAFGASTSGSVSGGVSSGGSTALSQSASQQAIAFEDVFARLFGGAEGAAAGLDPSLLTQASNQLFSGGIDFLSSIGGDAGTAFLQDRLTGESPVLQEQIGQLEQDVGRFFNEQLLPGITSEAIAVGQLGGGRQGVAQGLAAESAANAFSRGATALRAGDIAARDAAAGTLAGNALTGAQTGLGELPELYGLAQAGFGAALAPFQVLAGILGPQQVLTQAQSTSESESFQSAEDFARAFSQAFDFSRSDTRTRSRSKGFRIEGLKL